MERIGPWRQDLPMLVDSVALNSIDLQPNQRVQYTDTQRS